VSVEGGRIVIVGAGRGGFELLRVLVNTRDVQVCYVCDVNPDARGMLFARQHNIPCVSRFADFVNDPAIDLIFECTGRREVFDELNRLKPPAVSLIGSAGTRAIFSLFDHYDELSRNLQSVKLNLERRIIERTDELERALAALEQEKQTSEQLYERERQINEDKTKYLIHTTHQLKAPFAAIQSYVDVIMEGYTGDISGETRDILGKVKRRCELLQENIRDMLELAKLRAHLVDDFARDRFDLRELVDEVIERVSGAATAKRVALVAEGDTGIQLTTHRKHLYDLLSILVENAVKYSPAETTVRVVVQPGVGSKVAVEVRDQGIGIVPEHREKIFGEYFRANNAVRFEPNGTGLGLAIALQLARRLDVEIKVESEIDKGSTFTVQLG